MRSCLLICEPRERRHTAARFWGQNYDLHRRIPPAQGNQLNHQQQYDLGELSKPCYCDLKKNRSHFRPFSVENGSASHNILPTAVRRRASHGVWSG